MDLCPIITLWEGIRKLAASGEKLPLDGFSERGGWRVAGGLERKNYHPPSPAPTPSWRFRVNTYPKRDEREEERG